MSRKSAINSPRENAESGTYYYLLKLLC